MTKKLFPSVNQLSFWHFHFLVVSKSSLLSEDSLAMFSLRDLLPPMQINICLKSSEKDFNLFMMSKLTRAKDAKSLRQNGLSILSFK